MSEELNNAVGQLFAALQEAFTDEGIKESESISDEEAKEKNIEEIRQYRSDIKDVVNASFFDTQSELEDFIKEASDKALSKITHEFRDMVENEKLLNNLVHPRWLSVRFDAPFIDCNKYLIKQIIYYCITNLLKKQGLYEQVMGDGFKM